MRWVKRIALCLGALIAVGSVAAGIVDRIEQRKAEQTAKAEGKKIHMPYGPYEKYFKRPLDFALSSLALVVLSPVLLAIALAVRVKLGAPIVFSQPRPGKYEKIFRMIKFRSLTNDRDAEGNLLSDEQRMTPFGSWLRSTSLDELMEFFCILKGSMSIVGPRPLLVRDMVFMTTEQRKRHSVRPGLTGLAQVSGRNAMSWEKKLNFDLQYVDQGITLCRDMKILWKTVHAVLTREGINEKGMATAMDLGDALLLENRVTKEQYDSLQIYAKKLLKENV